MRIGFTGLCGMPRLPAQEIPAKISRNGEHPRGKFQLLFEAMSLLKNTYKRFLSNIERPGLGTDVAINVSRQRLLPAAHEFVEREILTLPELNHQLFIRSFPEVRHA